MLLLNQDQLTTLNSFLLNQLTVNPSTATLAIFVGEEIAHDIPILPRLQDIAYWLIGQTLTQPTPGSLIKLVRALDDGNAALASIVAIAARLEIDAQDWLDWRNLEEATAVDPLHVQDGRPFIDRGIFRDLLPKIDESETPDCIVVYGGAGSGKTYLHEYLKQLSALRRSFEVGFTAVGSSNARSMTPGVAAVDIALGLKTNFQQQPREHEDPHRYAKNLVSWITKSTPSRAAPSIAVFDGFNSDGISDPMHTFIEELIHSIQNDEVTRRRIRVVLLGYDVGRLEQRGLDYEQYTLEFLDQTHIEDWLELRFPERSRYQYEETASSIIERLPPTDELRLHQLCSLVRVAMVQFAESN